jgi:17 kDa outer membrane surface antigen
MRNLRQVPRSPANGSKGLENPMQIRRQSRLFSVRALTGLLACIWLAGPARADITSASSLDGTDQQQRDDALDRVLTAAPGGQTDWSNINSGHRGSFRSMSERPGEGGQTCRDIAETVWFQDGQSASTLVACRSGDDPWRIVSDNPEQKTPTPAPPAQGVTSQPPGLGNMPVQVWVGVPGTVPGTTVVVRPPSGGP